METILSIALGVVGVVAVVLGLHAWDLHTLCARQQKELWSLREALLLRRRKAESGPVARPRKAQTTY
jgi:hypothetical protein